MEVVSRHMKDKKAAGKTQLKFTKGKLSLTNLIAFCDEITCLVDERRVMDANYLDFNKAFDMFCPNIPVVGKILSGHTDRKKWLTYQDQRML